jgi:putative copper export protein
MDVSLRPLQSGVYVVIWRSVSAEDGHATGGNFLFGVTEPGVPVTLPGTLPAGLPALHNANSGQCLTGDAPLLCAPEVLSDWLVFLAAVVWIGGMFWQYFILEGAVRQDRSLVSIALATARRFRRVAVVALGLFVLANIGYVVGQAMLAGGDWGSGLSPTIWGGILLHSSFGIFWLLRELLALLALLLLVGIPEQAVREEDWRPRSALNWLRMALGLLLLVVMAFSGHAAAVQVSGGLGSFAVPVDWLHLLSLSLWLGGIIFIAITLMPALWGAWSLDRSRALVKLLPRFSVIALASVAVVALSGAFNADVHLTSWDQFVNTTYGRTLIIKILLVLAMILVSAYHAFRLRPALSTALRAWDRLEGAAGAGLARRVSKSHDQQTAAQSVRFSGPLSTHRPVFGQGSGTGPLAQRGTTIPLQRFSLPSISAVNAQQHDDTLESADVTDSEEEAPPGDQANGYQRLAPKSARAPAQIEQLSEQIRLWIRREAMLGAGVLLCAALLGGLAGSLAPASSGGSTPNTSTPTLGPNHQNAG